MPGIRILPEEVRNFISCGEVIESPSSVVKELVENSIDAGARRVDIKVVDSGLSLISVTDDGSGIAFDELPLAVSAFATSKLDSREGLNAVNTLGFRGEALASVCSVASVKIFSRPRKAAGGMIYREGDELIEHKKFDCPLGTSVEVRRLFYNAPVRKRFLKSEKYMKTEILRTVQNYALSRTDLVFTLEVDGKEFIEGLEASDSREDRIKKLFGFEGGTSAVSESPAVTVSFISYPREVKSSRRWQFVFVNGRPVSSPVLLRAAENAASGYFGKGKFPPIFIYVKMLPALVDVNVHPTKREIKFQSPGGMYNVLYELIKKKFSAEETVEYTQAPVSAREEDQTRIFSEHGPEEKEEDEASIIYNVPVPAVATNTPRPPESRKVDWDYLYYVGSTHRKFLIFSAPSAIHIVDFHAAAERINYEKLQDSADGNLPSQNLLVPVEIKLTEEEAGVLAENSSFLRKLGIIIERSAGPVVIKSLPAGFGGSEKEMMTGIAGALLEGEKEERAGGIHREILERSRDKVLKLVACHMSKRAGDSMARAEAESLIRDLRKCREPLRCPHGRPVMVTLPVSKIESMLLRG